MNTTSGITMNTTTATSALEDVKISVKVKLAGLWAAMMFLYVYADILSLYRPGTVDEMLLGQIGPFAATQGFLLMAGVLMMIPSVMVFLPLVLKPSLSRWVNIIVGVLYTAVNISNLIGETWAYYIGFGVLEIVITIVIIWTAWTWPSRNK